MADYPTSVGTRNDALLMKERMATRGSQSVSFDVPPAVAATNSHNTSGAAAAAAAMDEQQPSTKDLDRCRSLKDRIYDRTTRPMPTLEVTKDVYTHEQPFPVQTVYEMSRVRPQNPCVVGGSLPTSVSSAAVESAVPTGGDTLLLPQEAAVLVKSLEERLGVALQKITVLEEDLETYRLRTDTANTKHLTAEKYAAELNARNEELQKQLEAVRSECQSSLLSGAKTNEGVVAKALEECTERWQNVEASLKGEVDRKDEEIKGLTIGKNQLELLVRELKEQLVQNAQSLQTSTGTIRDLANELLNAKQQSSFISNGYKQIETQLKQANSLNHSQTAEIASLKNTVGDLEGERDRRAKAELELKEASETIARYEPAEAERKRLSELSVKLEKDMAEKDRELLTLKQQMDLVRNQAATAYEHTNRFRMGGGAPGVDPLSATLLGGGGAHGGLGHAGHGAALDDHLRREIEEEERRYNEESRRWRQKDASHR